MKRSVRQQSRPPAIAQIFIYALVNAIYIPCVATIAVLGKALGWKRAALVSAGTVSLAVLVGGVVMRILTFFN